MAEKWLAARCGDELVNHFTYVIAGDGCLMEGVSGGDFPRRAPRAGQAVVLWDDNQITIDGKTDLSTSEDQRQRFEAAGWHVQAVDGRSGSHPDRRRTGAGRDRQAIDDRLPHHDRLRLADGRRYQQGPRAPLGAEGCRPSRTTSAGPTILSLCQRAMDAWRAAGAGARAHPTLEIRLAASPQADQFNAMHAGALTDAAREALKRSRRSRSAISLPSPPVPARARCSKR